MERYPPDSSPNLQLFAVQGVVEPEVFSKLSIRDGFFFQAIYLPQKHTRKELLVKDRNSFPIYFVLLNIHKAITQSH